jgi:hypothetical protein
MQISSAHCSTYVTAGQTPMKTPTMGWYFLFGLLGNDKNEVFSFLVRSGAVTGRKASLLL